MDLEHPGAGFSRWWLTELETDPAYEIVVTPLLLELLEPAEEATFLDVGCGEGRLGRAVEHVGALVVGLDASLELLSVAGFPVVAHHLPSLGCFADAAFDGAFVSLVLEHVEEYRQLFGELGRVVRSEGVLALVVNHPVFTAPDSAPIVDDDGETLWRPGRYLDRGWTDEPAGDGTVRFHHRPLSELLTAASDAGWDLQRVVERGPSEEQIERIPLLAEQRHIPRLLGVRWIRRSATMAR